MTSTAIAYACWQSVAPCTDSMSFAPCLQLGECQEVKYRTHSLVSTQARAHCNPCSSLSTCSTLPAPLSQATLPGCILPSLTLYKPTTHSPDRLFGFYFRCKCMPASLLFSLQSLYAGNQYLPQDGQKAARIKPTVGVKQGSPLLHCSFCCILMTYVWLLREYMVQSPGQRMSGSRTCCTRMTWLC